MFCRRAFKFTRPLAWRFSTVARMDPVIPMRRVSELLQSGISKNQIQLLNYLAAQPISSKLSSEYKVLDDLYVQMIELHKQLEEATLSEEDRRFFENELNETKSLLNEEHERILSGVIVSLYTDEHEAIDSAILEFRGGVGGAESTLFANEMAEYYRHYLLARGCQVIEDNVAQSTSKVLRFKLKGERVFSTMICECGVHKVIRVPETESKGRLHSSTISIVVLPDVPFEFKLNERELRIDYMRAQGPGGQHVNKTDSACRITHLPTGISVHMQDDRSQAKNKARAMELIREKLYQMEWEKKEEEQKLKRKGQIGSGDRSDKIRTYNFPQDRITDHRLNKTVYGIVNYLQNGELFDICIAEINEAIYNDKIAQFYKDMNDKYPSLA
jgi:peptide chain release factor 1